MRTVVIDNNSVHGGEIVRRWGMENPPAGWTCERVPEGMIGDTVVALLSAPEPPGLILFAYSFAHLPAYAAAWTYARARGCLVVTALGSNTPGATVGPPALPHAYVTVGGDAAAPGEETGIGPGMWCEAVGYDGVPWQSYVTPTVGAALARAYEAVAGVVPEPGCDRGTLALRALLAGASGPRTAGQPFVSFDASRGFGLVTRDTVPVVPPPVLSPLVSVSETSAPGKMLVRLERLGGVGTQLLMNDVEQLQTSSSYATLYLGTGGSIVSARAVLADGSLAEAHAPSSAWVDVAQGYVPPAPAVTVQRVEGRLLVATEAEGAIAFTVRAQAGAEVPTPIEDGEVEWPAHLPARVRAEAIGAGGVSATTTVLVPAVRSTAPLAEVVLHPLLTFA